MDEPSPVSEVLVQLARMLADWAECAPGYTVYLFGSRVRGDHRSDSDVDLHLSLSGSVDEDTVFWKIQNEEEDYASIKALLPGPMKILVQDDALCASIEAAPVVHVDRNVRCVFLPRKPSKDRPYPLSL